MGQKIYVIRRSEGEYEDRYEYIEKAFYDVNKANEYVALKNQSFEKLENLRAEWEEIQCALEEAVPQEYWDEIENITEESREIPQYWSDSKETFIKSIKETIPNKYELHGETLLIEMYEYFEANLYKWDGKPYFYIAETEIE